MYLWIPVSGVYIIYINSEGDVLYLFSVRTNASAIFFVIWEPYCSLWNHRTPRLFAMERHGNYQILRNDGDHGKNEGHGVNAIIKVSHKYF